MEDSQGEEDFSVPSCNGRDKFNKSGGLMSNQSFGDESNWKHEPNSKHYVEDKFGKGSSTRNWKKNLDQTLESTSNRSSDDSSTSEEEASEENIDKKVDKKSPQQ